MSPRLFLATDPRLDTRARAVASRLPPIHGRPIRIELIPSLRDRRGPVHAAAFIRDRRIAFDCSLSEFPRIFVHELFHFVWLRSGNPIRWSFETLIAAEVKARAKGELGWSSEWRKSSLQPADLTLRARRWREYACESFCDTAAWLYSGMNRHSEFTLSARCRAFRRLWFEREMEHRGLSI